MLTNVNSNKVGGGLLFKSTCIAALLLGTALTPAHADELSELKAQIRAMKAASAAVEKRLVRLEKSKTAKSGNNNKLLAATGGPGTEAPALVTSAYPGYITVPGTDTSIKIGGYVKIDGTYDARGGGLGGIGSDFRDIYLSGTAKANRAGDFQVGARQTNLTLSTISPTAYGDVKTFIKADLYGAPNGNAQYSNSYTPRLYQAFITANLAGGTVEVGQDWSTFIGSRFLSRRRSTSAARSACPSSGSRSCATRWMWVAAASCMSRLNPRIPTSKAPRTMASSRVPAIRAPTSSTRSRTSSRNTPMTPAGVTSRFPASDATSRPTRVARS